MNTKIEIITGRKGQGKSGLAYHHARLARVGVAIFDPNAQFSIGTVSDNPAQFEESLDADGNVVVYRSVHNVEDDFAAFVECICVAGSWPLSWMRLVCSAPRNASTKISTN